jgi:hypothetical protein
MLLPLYPLFLVVSVVVGGAMMSSPERMIPAFGPAAGAVGEELHAEMTREATATTARVRWRRDMGNSVVGWMVRCEPCFRT